MGVLKRLISYPLSVIYYVFFGLTLLIFHPLQWLFLNIGGYRAHQTVVNYMNLVLVRYLHILGTKISFRNNVNLPTDRPLIIVSNHQSSHDVATLSWYLRKFHPKFVAKKELEKGIPSVSFNLRHGGSALIDRSNPKQALTELKKLGTLIEKKTYSAVIFPEGTRSRDGVPKKFSENGLKMLVRFAPSAIIVPITINNSWKFLKDGWFPLPIGEHLSFDVHEPIETNSLKFAELFEKVEQTIKNAVIL